MIKFKWKYDFENVLVYITLILFKTSIFQILSYLGTELTFATLLLFVPMIILFPFNVLVALVLIDVGEITWMTGTLFPVFGSTADVFAADNTFKGRDVVDIVMRLGVELPIDFWGFAITEAAFANNEPVRLLKAGTVVNWMVGADKGTFVIVVAAEGRKWMTLKIHQNVKVLFL